MATPRCDKRIYISSVLVATGLIIQMLTLLWTHPLAFIASLLIGVPLVLAGAILYLYSLLFRGGEEISSQ